jgi:hypothetical protein
VKLLFTVLLDKGCVKKVVRVPQNQKNIIFQAVFII